MAQLVEHILGKDEVIGSIPISSSKKATQKVAFFIQAAGLIRYNFYEIDDMQHYGLISIL